MSVKQGGIKYHFWVFGMTRLGIEPQSPGPLANTLLIRQMARFVNIIFKFFTCLLVWFTTLCFVPSLQSYAWYNMYIYIYIYILVWILYIYIHTYIYIHIYIYIYILTDRGNMCIYVKMHAIICVDIRIYVCASDFTYTNTLMSRDVCVCASIP